MKSANLIALLLALLAVVVSITNARLLPHSVVNIYNYRVNLVLLFNLFLGASFVLSATDNIASGRNKAFGYFQLIVVFIVALQQVLTVSKMFPCEF